MVKCEKPTIYLPVEIKARELKAKILLSMVAAEAGFRVYLGTKKSINNLVFNKEKKGGIYFYKGGKPYDFLCEIKKKIDSFVVLDEEMGPALHDIEMYCRRRIYPGTELLVDQLFVIGAEHKINLESARSELRGRVHVTGWPRVDLWRPEFSGLYAEEVESIRCRFGDYVLFSSDFGFLSEERVIEEVERFQKIEVLPSDVEDYKKMAWSTYLDFKVFVDWVRRIDEDDSFPPLIIRPHPSESISDWNMALPNLKKVKIIFEGDVGPWLYAAKGLIHRGCTTAVQAYTAKIPSVYWVGDNSRPKVESLVYRVSTPAVGCNELSLMVRKLFNDKGQLVSIDVSDRIFIDEELSCSKIVTLLASMRTTPACPYEINFYWRAARFIFGALNEFRQMRGWGGAKSELARARRKMLGGIHRKEVSMIAGKLLPMFPGSVIERDFNLIEFDCDAVR